MTKYQMTKNDRDYIFQKMNKAINRGIDNASWLWKQRAFEILYDYCCENEFVTANDITPILKQMDVKTHDNRSIGGLFVTAKSMGWIAPTGQKIKSKYGHFSRIEIWKSLVYGQGEAIIKQNNLF